jgi:hypothetical protein
VSLCRICGKTQLHGSHLGGKGGTYLGESGCHQGVWMDDDEYGEGWADDTIYPPCPNHPKCCKKCGGSGIITKWNVDKTERWQEDCPNKTCNSGWKGKPQWPERAIDEGETP